MQYKCLSIAGFDGSGGAGLQADLKTFSALGCYGMTVLTALPVQNTCGVRHCYSIEVGAVMAQLKAIFDDIIPTSIKVGMLFSKEIIESVADFLHQNAQGIPIVLDPVMVAKSGDHLLRVEAIKSLKTVMMPLATLVTPNLPEAQTLLGKPPLEKGQLEQLGTRPCMETMAKDLIKQGAQAVLLKGGHGAGSKCDDLFLKAPQPLDKKVSKPWALHWLEGNRIMSRHTHGTGCTLSAAIAAYLAQGHSLLESCCAGKMYVSGAIKAAQFCSVGHGQGPVHHFYNLWPYLERDKKNNL